MSQKELRERLARLHSELSQTNAVDDRARELLASVQKDIEELLERPAEGKPEEHASLLDRLREAARHFEGSHPALTTAMGRVIDTLANMGI